MVLSLVMWSKGNSGLFRASTPWIYLCSALHFKMVFTLFVTLD